MNRQIFLGIVSMTAGIFCLSAMDAAVRWLILDGITAVQVIAMRGWIIFTVMMLWVWRRNGLVTLVTRRPWHHLLRALLGMFAPLSFFIALKTIPLAEATAVFFCSVFLLTIGSVIFFKERVGPHRWAAVIVGFTGVLIVTQPTSATFQPEILLVLLASLAYTALILMGRWMSSTESTFSLVFSFSAVSMIAFTLALPWFYSSMTWPQIEVLALVSMLALTGHFLLTHAFMSTPISIVAPFEYSALAWASVFGFLLWDDVPALTTFIGIAIIVISGCYIVWRENHP
ncbi:MAG: hypothetical protein DHS20C01_28150 [marine bacterium B5-7]|nr:MAG: hypothetical protein DHS20C01_28150 [marine bacterium B5-7]